MKDSIIYALAIVIAAFAIGYYYALCHRFQRAPYRSFVNGQASYCTLDTWTGNVEKPAPFTNQDVSTVRP